jgi:hypothetical protein
MESFTVERPEAAYEGAESKIVEAAHRVAEQFEAATFDAHEFTSSRERGI